MPHVDDGSLATNSDAAMWRQDHASAIRYIEALLAERERWAPVIEAARRLDVADWEYMADLLMEECFARYEREAAICRVIAAALKEGNADG